MPAPRVRALAGAGLLSLVLLLAATPALAPASRSGGLPAPDGARSVLVLGDSLAVGMRPFLGAELPAAQLTWAARSGRTTPQGLVALRAALRRERPDAAVVSLGTNDGADPARFRDRIGRVLDLLPDETCVVWATIARPPRKGPFRGLNRVLRRESRRRGFALVAWDAQVAAGAVRLPDRLHPDAAGFQLRTRMFADALRADCGAG